MDSYYNRYSWESLEQNLPNSNFSKFIKNENLDHKKYQISMKSHFPKTNFTKYTLNDPNTGIFKFFTVFGHTKVAPLAMELEYFEPFYTGSVRKVNLYRHCYGWT